MNDLHFKRRTPKPPTDEQFGRLVLGTQGKLSQLGSRLYRGVLTPREYFEAMFDLLERAHLEAAVMGRKLGGDHSDIEADDEAFAQLVMDSEAQFMGKFEQDLLFGRYTGEDGEYLLSQINARAKLYTGKIRATANETFVLASKETDAFAWHELTAEHCADCPVIAAGGPYTYDQLRNIGFPGGGRQQCKTHCGCVLVRLRDKVIGFSRSYL